MTLSASSLPIGNTRALSRLIIYQIGSENSCFPWMWTFSKHLTWGWLLPGGPCLKTGEKGSQQSTNCEETTPKLTQTLSSRQLILFTATKSTLRRRSRISARLPVPPDHLSRVRLSDNFTPDNDYIRASQIAQWLKKKKKKNPPANAGDADSIPGSRRVPGGRHSNPFQYSCLGNWRRQWQPTPVLLPGKSHGRRSLVGCSPWGR